MSFEAFRRVAGEAAAKRCVEAWGYEPAAVSIIDGAISPDVPE